MGNRMHHPSSREFFQEGRPSHLRRKRRPEVSDRKGIGRCDRACRLGLNIAVRKLRDRCPLLRRGNFQRAKRIGPRNMDILASRADPNLRVLWLSSPSRRCRCPNQAHWQAKANRSEK